MTVPLGFQGAAVSQTASELTPDSFQPQTRRLSGSIEFTGQTGTQAPPGAEAISIQLSRVTIRGGLIQLQSAHEATEQRLTRGRIPVSELFKATADLEAAYAEAGYVLTRVVLPQQSLSDGGALQIEVVNGFIEQVDTTGTADNTEPRIQRLTQRLLNKPGLTLSELERQLLLAGDVPGTALRTALGAGQSPGSTVLAIEADYRRLTGFVGFGNPLSEELGRVDLSFGAELNSPFKWGETFYIRGSGSPDRYLSNDPRSRVLAIGAVVPLRFSGLALNVETTVSKTRPDDPDAPTRSKFTRDSIRLSYPFIRSRQANVSGQLIFDRQDDRQESLTTSPTVQLYHDRTSVFRVGVNADYLHENGAITGGSLLLSRGVDAFGAVSRADGAILSRTGADVSFTKLSASFFHRRALTDQFALSVSARAQTGFGDPLLTSELFGIVGPQELSTFDSGTLRGDSGWVLRSEISTQRTVELGTIPLLLSPYAFAGFGQVFYEQPTTAEQAKTTASAFGLGVDIFTQTGSNFRSGSLRLELGQGDTKDATPKQTRFSISGNFRF